MNVNRYIIMIVVLFSMSFVQAEQPLLCKKAPLFRGHAVFPDGSVKDLKLADYQGKYIVLYFYPMDNTPGCTKQAEKFRDDIERLYDKGIVLIGISCDSIKSHKKFQQKYNLPYPLVSDSRWHRTISKLYGVAGFLYSKRTTFLINKEGIIFKVFDHVNIQHQIDDILKAFEQEC